MMRPSAKLVMVSGSERKAADIDHACVLLKNALGAQASVPIAEILKAAIRSGIVQVDRRDEQAQ